MHIIEQISVWSGKIFSFLAAVVVGLISFEVVARYVFNAPTSWGYEVMVYSCGVYYVMGGAYTLYLQGHVSVNVLHRRASPRIRAVLDLVTFPLIFAYLGTLVWMGTDIGLNSLMSREASGSAWGPPIYPVKLMIPLGAFLMLLQAFTKFIRDFRQAAGREVPVQRVEEPEYPENAGI